MLGDMRGERWPWSELEDRGGRRLLRGCDRGWESVDICRCGLRYSCEVGAGALGVTGVASRRRPMRGSTESGECARGISK